MNRPLIVITGPTGIGKTQAAIRLAGRLRNESGLTTEIVGADSRQIYRYMDIGTAKPTAEERAAVPHHLIDLVDPDETLTMSEVQRLAYTAIDSLHEQGKLPLFVGGTGQYLTAVLEGWQAPEVPPQPELRAQLEAEAAEHGAARLYDRLLQLDPQAATLMDRHNIRRLVRALEVCIVTGRPFSEQRRKSPPPYHVLQFGLTTDRDALYKRLDARIDSMMARGLLDEVIALRERGYDWSLPAMTSLGYDQLGKYLRTELTLDAAIALIKTDTHLFVRRQYTWFRKYLQPAWIDLPSVDQAVDVMFDALRNDTTLRIS